MSTQQFVTVAEQRPATGALWWLSLHAPELARRVRPGQYVLVRCAEPERTDLLLRRGLFVAAAEETLGQIGLLYAADEPGLQWLSRQRAGDQIDIAGPFGTPFTIERTTRTLLLLGSGPGLGALLLLARRHLAQGGNVALLAAAHEAALLPPPFLLPADIEYQSVVGNIAEMVVEPPPVSVAKKSKRPAPPSQPSAIGGQINWADQVCAALAPADVVPVQDAIRRATFRWERGFAQALLEGTLVCGVGACGLCSMTIRKGRRLLCSDGPVFDLRDLSE